MMFLVIASMILVGRAAAVDCEAFRTGLLRQPVNAYSSLVILAAGLWILLLAAREELRRRGELIAFGAAMSITGVGSLLLHGPAPGWALWFHDLSGLTVLLLVAVLNLGLVLGWTLRRRLRLVAAVLVPLALELAILPTSTVPIAWALAPAAALSELVVLVGSPRRSLDPRSSARRTRAWLIAAGTIVLAGAAYLLGRSGSPRCHPASVLQWHAVWHVLVAVSATAFAYAAFVFDENAGHDRLRGAART
jgi:hypothetical protein